MQRQQANALPIICAGRVGPVYTQNRAFWKISNDMLLPKRQCVELFGQRNQISRPVTRRGAVNNGVDNLNSRKYSGGSFSRLPMWQKGIREHQRPLSRDLSCQAESGSLDIEYIHPPREGKLESENLRSNVRKQVDHLALLLMTHIPVVVWTEPLPLINLNL